MSNASKSVIVEFAFANLLRQLSGAIFILTILSPSSVLARGDVQAAWKDQYGTTQGCTNCHFDGTGGVDRADVNDSPYAKLLFKELGSELPPIVKEPDTVEEFEKRKTEIRNAMNEISEYLGRVKEIEALDRNGARLKTVKKPEGDRELPAQTAKLLVRFIANDGVSVEEPFWHSSNTVEDHGMISPDGFTASPSDSDFEIELGDEYERRLARKNKAFPFDFEFRPTTSLGFKPPTDKNLPTNKFNIQTANYPPIAVDDVFQPTLSEVHDNLGNPIPYNLDVLIVGGDFDPDHKNAKLKVPDAEPALTPAYGSIAVNGNKTGYIYTAPVDLDPAVLEVTFEYSVVDEEGAISPTATVTIDLRNALTSLPPKSFVANDDVFILGEGSDLVGADIKADNGSGVDDLDGTPLNEVFFTVVVGPSVEFETFNLRPDGTFDFEPKENFSGDVTFTYRLSDGSNFDEAVVTLRVAPDNDPPTAKAITLTSANEIKPAFTTDLLDSIYVEDLDGDELNVQNVTFTITQRPAEPARSIDRKAAVSISGKDVTINPAAFAALDNSEFADVLINYEISDGIADPVLNTLFVTIVGLDNSPARQPGAYADSLSSRYISASFGQHFKGQNSAPSACLTCHVSIKTLDADVDTVDECDKDPVFTAYGLELCLNRDEGAQALTDLVRRMVEAEPNYAPRLMATDTLQVLQSEARGTAIGAPLTTSFSGRDVFGKTAQIHSYLISIGEESPPATTDPSGQFSIAANGQISVASDDLIPGSYTFIVLPVNDAGQRDNNETRISAPGFFSNAPGPESAVTIEVLGDMPTPVDDSINVSINRPVDIAVLANDSGGDADSVSITSTASNGSVVVNSDLTLTYTPEKDFIGEDSFSYASRNVAGPSTTSANVSVTVVAADGVVAVDDTITAIKGRTTVINVLANDENTRRDGIGASVVTITSRPDPNTVGSISLVGQSISFTPVSGFIGATSFSYRAANPTSAGDLGSNASVSLNVIAVGEGAITNIVIDPELKKVARSLEQSCVDVSNLAALDQQSQQFLNVCALLTVAATEQEDLEQTMRALRNEEHFAAVDATAIVGRGLGRVIDRRLSQIRDGGARGFNTSAISLKLGGQEIPTELLGQVTRGVLGLGIDEFDAPAWGIFIAGDIALAERDSSSTSGGYEVEAGNLMIGFDQALDDRSSAGGALGYSETSTEFAEGGSLTGKGFQVSLYGVQKDFTRPGLTLEGYVSFGQMNFNSNRRINFSHGGEVVDTFAKAEFDGNYINIVPKLSFSNVLGEYNDPIGAPLTATRITWSTSLDYLWMNLDDYTETNSMGLGLNVQSDAYQSLILAFGLDASRPVYFGPNTRAEIYGGLEVRGELLDKDRSVSSAFAVAGPNAHRFIVSEKGNYGIGAAFEVGTLFSIGSNGLLDLSYGYEFASGGLSIQHITLGFSREIFGNDSLSLSGSGDYGAAGGTSMVAKLDYGLKY